MIWRIIIHCQPLSGPDGLVGIRIGLDAGGLGFESQAGRGEGFVNAVCEQLVMFADGVVCERCLSHP